MVIDQTWQEKKKEGGEKERRGQGKERREARLRSPSPALSRASLLEITGPSARMKGAGRKGGGTPESHTWPPSERQSSPPLGRSPTSHPLSVTGDKPQGKTSVAHIYGINE